MISFLKFKGVSSELAAKLDSLFLDDVLLNDVTADVLQKFVARLTRAEHNFLIEAANKSAFISQSRRDEIKQLISSTAYIEGHEIPAGLYQFRAPIKIKMRISTSQAEDGNDTVSFDLELPLDIRNRVLSGIGKAGSAAAKPVLAAKHTRVKPVGMVKPSTSSAPQPRRRVPFDVLARKKSEILLADKVSLDAVQALVAKLDFQTRKNIVNYLEVTSRPTQKGRFLQVSKILLGQATAAQIKARQDANQGVLRTTALGITTGVGMGRNRF